jgi:hypothetical protein
VTQSVAIVFSTDGLEAGLTFLTVFTNIANLKINKHLYQGISTFLYQIFKKHFTICPDVVTL